MTHQELVERSKHHFKKEDVKSMWATEDGQMFHSHAKNHALNHALANKLADPIAITRADINSKTKPEADVVEATKEDFEALKAEWNKLSGGKSLNKRIKYATLLGKVEVLRPEEGSEGEPKTKPEADE